MAIIVEEERPKVSTTSILMWLAILIVIGAAVYYVFFSRPEIVGVAVPQAFENIGRISEISLNPEDVINSSQFQSLKQYVASPVPGNTGRANPFIPPQ